MVTFLYWQLRYIGPVWRLFLYLIWPFLLCLESPKRILCMLGIFVLPCCEKVVNSLCLSNHFWHSSWVYLCIFVFDVHNNNVDPKVGFSPVLSPNNHIYNLYWGNHVIRSCLRPDVWITWCSWCYPWYHYIYFAYKHFENSRWKRKNKLRRQVFVYYFVTMST